MAAFLLTTDGAKTRARLTPRERQVIAFVASGLMNKATRARTAVGKVTVTMHRGSARRSSEQSLSWGSLGEWRFSTSRGGRSARHLGSVTIKASDYPIVREPD